jgi:hypothetical protein
VAVLHGCGLRRAELAVLQLDDLQQREDHWIIAALIGAGGSGMRLQYNDGLNELLVHTSDQQRVQAGRWERYVCVSRSLIRASAPSTQTRFPPGNGVPGTRGFRVLVWVLTPAQSGRQLLQPLYNCVAKFVTVQLRKTMVASEDDEVRLARVVITPQSVGYEWSPAQRRRSCTCSVSQVCASTLSSPSLHSGRLPGRPASMTDFSEHRVTKETPSTCLSNERSPSSAGTSRKQSVEHRGTLERLQRE